MPKYFAQFLNVTLAWTIFVSGSILPSLHRHEGISCCATTAGEHSVAGHASASSAHDDYCHGHSHATLTSESEDARPTRDSGYGDDSSVADGRGPSDVRVSDECSLCRFLGQQRIAVSDSVEIPATGLLGQTSVISTTAPDLRVLLAVRSRGPPTAS